MFRALALAAFATAALGVTAASAKVIQTDLHARDNPTGQGGVWMSYDTVNESFGFKYDTGSTRGNTDGFWLVVSDGPNPKSHVNEYAILYGDLANNRITAYSYDGRNGPNSYQDPNRFIASYDNAFTQMGTNVGFTLDVSTINGFLTGPDWDGIQLDQGDFGLWFHESIGSNFTYDANGQIQSYGYTAQVWTDLHKQRPSWMGMWDSPDCTTGTGAGTGFANHCTGTTPNNPGGGGGGEVPVPGGLAFIGAALALAMRRRG